MERTPLTKESGLLVRTVMHMNMGKIHHYSYRNDELGISMGKRSERLKDGTYNVEMSYSFDEKPGEIYDKAADFMKAYNDHYFPENK